MRTITVADLRQNPTGALREVEAGETYVVTRHRHPVAKLVPVASESLEIVPPRRQGGSQLAGRSGERPYTHDQMAALLADMAEDR